MDKEMFLPKIKFSSKNLSFSDKVRAIAIESIQKSSQEIFCQECNRKICDDNGLKVRIHHLIEKNTARNHLPHTQKIRDNIVSNKNCLVVCNECEENRRHGHIASQLAIAMVFLGLGRSQLTDNPEAPPTLKSASKRFIIEESKQIHKENEPVASRVKQNKFQTQELAAKEITIDFYEN